MPLIPRPAYRLTKEITIVGHDLFGRRASVELIPHELSGIYVDVGKDEPVLVTPENLTSSRCSLHFTCDGFKIRNIGPLLALRWWVDGFTIRTATGWLPFDGTAQVFLGAVHQSAAVAEEGTLLPFGLPQPWCLGEATVHAWIFISESAESDTDLKLTVGYDRLRHAHGAMAISHERKFSRDDFPDIACARGFGYPQSLRPLSALAARSGLWRHHHHFLWTDAQRDATTWELVVDEALRHRELNLLACLASALPPGYFPIGTVTSLNGSLAKELNMAALLHRMGRART
ncbi:hypothetical protein K2Q16_00935 [Patescibacteria group bacterium]|nr:hypothetical protein [Patescibacteria group bacterium]